MATIHQFQNRPSSGWTPVIPYRSLIAQTEKGVVKWDWLQSSAVNFPLEYVVFGALVPVPTSRRSNRVGGRPRERGDRHRDAAVSLGFGPYSTRSQSPFLARVFSMESPVIRYWNLIIHAGEWTSVCWAWSCGRKEKNSAAVVHFGIEGSATILSIGETPDLQTKSR